MPKPSEGTNKQGAGAPAAGTPPAGATVAPPADEARPPASGGSDAPANPRAAAGEMPKSAATPPADGGEKAGAGMPSAPPKKEGKKRIKCAALKGGKIIVGKGEPINVDDDGFFEVSEAEAARLLTIPGYEEAKN